MLIRACNEPSVKSNPHRVLFIGQEGELGRNACGIGRVVDRMVTVS